MKLTEKKSARFGFFTLVLATLIIGGFSFQALAASDPLQELYKAAKAEGKVIFWGPADPEEISAVVTAFKNKFPGIEVEHFEIREEDYGTRVIAEARQGRVSLDVGNSKLAVALPLMERDLIQPYSDWQTIFKDLRRETISENGRFLTWYNMVFPIAYNTKLIKPEDVPRTWDDLLDPKWKGKLILEMRGNAFSYIGVKWGEAKLLSFLKKLKEQKPIFVKGGTTVLQQLTAGVAPLAVGTYLHKVIQSQKKGAPLDWAKSITPLGASTNSNFAMKGAPHPNAAKLFMGFISSEETIKISARTAFKGPMYPGSPVPGVAELAKNKVELVMEESSNLKEINQMIKLSEFR